MYVRVERGVSGVRFGVFRDRVRVFGDFFGIVRLFVSRVRFCVEYCF